MPTFYLQPAGPTTYKKFNPNITINTPNHTSKMAFLPRAFATEFAPIFHLLDDYAAHSLARSSGAACARQIRTFQPKFDIKENRDSYELHGELPGVQRDNLTIEFTDSQTLAVKGRTESHREEGTRPATVEAAPAQAALESSSDATTAAATPQSPKQTKQAYVEDDDAFVQVDNTSTTTAPESTNAVEKQQPQVATPAEDTPASRYWLSERSVGTFARSFQFPTRVDQDNVKASLTNGILSIVIPKSVAPQSRRINIE